MQIVGPSWVRSKGVKEGKVIKYLLLVIPIYIYFSHLVPFYSLSIQLEGMVNLLILLLCLILLLRQMTYRTVFDWIMGICFTVYFCILYDRTIEFHFFLDNFRFSIEDIKYVLWKVNVVPIRGVFVELSQAPSLNYALYQIVGNTIMLAPLAFSMLYFKWTKSFVQAIWYSFLCTVGIELIQLFQNVMEHVFGIGIGRSTDIDDVILNTIGAILGAGCYYMWKKAVELFRKGKTELFT